MIDIVKCKLFILVLIATLTSCSMKSSTINSADVYRTREFGFSQAAIFNNVIYGSGQVGWNKDYALPSNPDFKHQLTQTLTNITCLLQDQRCDWKDVLHLRFYVVNLNPAKRDRIANFLQRTFPNGYAPATTILGVSALARENLLLEIEFTAKMKQR